MPDFSDDKVTARFADQAVGVSVSKLLSNVGSLVTLISPGSRGEIFRINGHGFEHCLWVDETKVWFRRNQHLASRPINFPERNTRLCISWDFDKFQLAVFSDEEVGDDSVCETVPTHESIYVPNTLITWARQRHKLPRQTFQSLQEAVSVVLEAKEQIEQRIRDSNMYSLFWDFDRTGGPKKLPEPKREPQSFGGILGLLQDDAVIKGYTVVPEGGASSGRLDAHVIASLEEGQQVKIAIEGKNAHSRNLEHGLTEQLPEYMRAIDADYGLYLALWYKCEVFDQPKQSWTDLGIKLMKMRPFENIHTDLIKLSLPQSPSERGFEFR